MEENKNKVIQVETETTKIYNFGLWASALKFAALCGVIAMAVYVTKNPNYMWWLLAWIIIDQEKPS